MDLILHEGNQGTHNNGSLVAVKGWNLVAQRFALPSGPKYGHVAFVQQRVNDFSLSVAKGRVAKGVLQGL